VDGGTKVFSAVPDGAVPGRVSRRYAALVVAIACCIADLAALQAPAMAGNSMAPSPAQYVVRLSAEPAAVVDDAPGGRVFVVTSTNGRQSQAAVVTLRARDGKILATTPLFATPRRLPAAVSCFTPCMAPVDGRSGRVFVLSPYLNGQVTGPPYAFMLKLVAYSRPPISMCPRQAMALHLPWSWTSGPTAFLPPTGPPIA
jgi:hypothetical protein